MSGGVCGQDGIAGHCGAEGVSFVYRQLPNATFGEEGMGAGLRVSFLSVVSPRIEVAYRYVELLSVGAPSLRSSSAEFVAIEVLHNGDGLSVRCDGEFVVSNLTLPRWDPRPGWRLASVLARVRASTATCWARFRLWPTGASRTMVWHWK